MQSHIARAQDARPAVVERALDALAEVVVVGGGEFLARRWRADAWPQLSRLLREGPAFRRWPRPHGRHRRGALYEDCTSDYL